MAAEIKSISGELNRTDLSRPALAEMVLARGEGEFSSSGAIVVQTGDRTGRSPRDRFIVNDESTSDTVDWGSVNQPIDPDVFDALWTRVGQYLASRDVTVNNLHVGAHPSYYLPIHVTTEYAWHALFARALFIEPDHFNAGNKPTWEIMSAPGFACVPARDCTHSDGTIMIDFSRRRVLLAGLRYAGELKKAMFSVLNFLLPDHDVLPMHCSANIDQSDEVCLFFGLSGTGKTTLSSDPLCRLIGDDEHGWGAGSVFNFEGGCYAKCINLSQENEPVIYDAIRFGAIIENVIIDPVTREPDFTDATLTENTRACYPRENVSLKVEENRGPEPSTVIFLTCDVSGVLPPISILTKEQAAYHFLSGYTAQVGSTVVGSTEDYTATFSSGFGAAFLPRPPNVYADLLMRRIELFGSRVYLVNTGWTGGGYSVGRRLSIPTTRAIVLAARSGQLDSAPTTHLPNLNLTIPQHVPGIDNQILNPRSTWPNPRDYDEAAATLARKFQQNFSQFSVSSNVAGAGPG